MFLKDEFLEMLPSTIFFFVVFHIILFTRALMANQSGITIASSASATIGALIVGKSILIAGALPLFNWFRQNRSITCLGIFAYEGVFQGDIKYRVPVFCGV